MPRPYDKALKAAGYVRTGKYWVTQDDYDMIMYIAKKHLDPVMKIRIAVQEEQNGERTDESE
jgi:hypothetical protein